nr:DEAD/DEAH box helicase [Acidobacteriota bacterium]
QQIGVEWLRFLYENRLAGLLCDDMGLGKTHQAMALLVSLREQEGVDAPFLVVCPTSVISHWRNKIRDHAPGLRVLVYHGAQRSLGQPEPRGPKSTPAPPGREGAEGPRGGEVVVTSYGVLRRDVEALSRVRFALAIFDEIQHVKNRGTRTYEATAQLQAEVKLGLTGTPIENALLDLKALFDLLLPGYFGSDADFLARYVDVDERKVDPEERLEELRRMISPFVLRRLKTAVLDELPEKFEDLRTCALSDDQVKLYRDATAGRGAELARQLESTAGPVPYIHVFALLNLLKQICDHPALALGQLEKADDFTSGKWDLYREILEECLGSGHKVVVFTQYLGMIALMERHLTGLGVGYATLTGSSTGRGEIVDRFNLDPACRVFLGSLKAGGTGIDLVGGSVVIHYDRWWNAAREDQATDRVYRIGQKRAVQVVKLITEGTLEEKISAIIDRKRRMMESVIQADDPSLAKLFSREELLSMLQGV